jgi:hypothetical protein
VDRVACPWLIRKFVDPQAEFLFVPGDQVMVVAQREGATPYDVKDVELGHHGKECSFDAIVKKHGLTGDPARKGSRSVARPIARQCGRAAAHFDHWVAGRL